MRSGKEEVAKYKQMMAEESPLNLFSVKEVGRVMEWMKNEKEAEKIVDRS